MSQYIKWFCTLLDGLVQSNIKEIIMFFRTDGIDDMDELLPDF